MKLRFPSQEILGELEKCQKLLGALDTYADIIMADVRAHEERSITPECAAMCRDYLRVVASASSNGAVGNHMKLRAAVYTAIFNVRGIIDSPVETVWDTIVVYGPLNCSSVVSYLDSQPRGVPIKLAKLLLSKAQNNETGNDFEKAVAVAMSSPKFCAEICSPSVLQVLRQIKHSSPLAQIILKLENIYSPNSDICTLRNLFPQITISQASKLLKSGSLEQVTQQILDNPESINVPEPQATKKKFKRLIPKDQRQSEPPAFTREKSFLEKSLNLALAAMDDEDPDDSLDQPFETLSSADQKLWQQEEHLFREWKRHPETFSVQSRKSPERKKLAKTLGWTDEQIEGWERTLTGDTRRISALEWRYTMGKGVVGKPQPRSETPQDSDDEAVSPQPTEVENPGTQTPGNKRNHRRDQRREIQRDKDRNQKRDQRKAKFLA